MTSDEKIRIAVNTFIAFGLGLVFGPWPMGLLQDKLGHKAALLYIFTNTLIFNSLLVIVNEIEYFNFWFACFIMFGLGLVDNCLYGFLNMIFGMEFESKIMPAAARQFLEQMSVFSFLAALSIWSLETKEQFRPYFIFYLVIGIISQLIVLRVAKTFKVSS